MNLTTRIDEKIGPIWRGVCMTIAGVSLFFLTLLAISMLVSGARADSPTKRGAVAAPADEVTLTSTAARWTGPWAAGVVGYGIDVVETESTKWWKPDTVAVGREPLFGGALGYDYQFAGTGFVVGAGIDAMWSRSGGEPQVTLYGRGGYLLNPWLLAYAGAGITDPAGGFQFSDTKLVVLGGLEAMIGSSGWFVRGEGRWLDPEFGDNSDHYAAMVSFGYRFGAGR